jgi:hypothetical protein
VKKLEEILSPFKEARKDSNMKWKVWVNETYTKNTKDGTETQSKHMVLKEKESTVG